MFARPRKRRHRLGVEKINQAVLSCVLCERSCQRPHHGGIAVGSREIGDPQIEADGKGSNRLLRQSAPSSPVPAPGHVQEARHICANSICGIYRGPAISRTAEATEQAAAGRSTRGRELDLPQLDRGPAPAPAQPRKPNARIISKC